MFLGGAKVGECVCLCVYVYNWVRGKCGVSGFVSLSRVWYLLFSRGEYK